MLIKGFVVFVDVERNVGDWTNRALQNFPRRASGQERSTLLLVCE